MRSAFCLALLAERGNTGAFLVTELNLLRVIHAALTHSRKRAFTHHKTGELQMSTRAKKELAAAYICGENISRMAIARMKREAAVKAARSAMGETYRRRNSV
jgi:hypothetical protein